MAAGVRERMQPEESLFTYMDCITSQDVAIKLLHVVQQSCQLDLRAGKCCLVNMTRCAQPCLVMPGCSRLLSMLHANHDLKISWCMAPPLLLCRKWQRLLWSLSAQQTCSLLLTLPPLPSPWRLIALMKHWLTLSAWCLLLHAMMYADTQLLCTSIHDIHAMSYMLYSTYMLLNLLLNMLLYTWYHTHYITACDQCC